MTLTLHTPQGSSIEVSPLDSSKVFRSLSDGDRMVLEWRSETPQEVPVGTTAEADGIAFRLFYPIDVRKEHSRSFTHTATLHTDREALKLIKIKDIGHPAPSVEFVLTGTPQDFVRFVARSMGEGWQVGSVLEGGIKTLSFSHDYCHDALSRIAEAYDTEWRVEGKTLCLGKLELNKDNPLPLSYGLGHGFRSGVVMRKSTAGTAPGRLYIQGGRRNIAPSDYGSTTLCLPKSASYDYYGYSYTTDETGSYVKGRYFDSSLAEASYDATAVYPSRIGRVTAVETTREGFVDIIDADNPIDYTATRIGGEKAVIVFLSGMLTGREIEIAQDAKTLSGYVHSERRFKLVQKEEDGFLMPGKGYMPAVGDAYAVFGIKLPQAYIEAAEVEAFHQAVHYLHELEALPYAFDGELDPVFCRKEWLRIGGKILPGSYILFSDPQFFPAGQAIRITALSYPLGKPWAADLTLTNSPAPASVSTALGKLKAAEVLRQKERRSDLLSARRTFDHIEETRDMVDRAFADLGSRIEASTLQAMQLVIGSREGQFDFVESRANPVPLAVYPLSWSDQGNILTFTAATLRHHALGQKGTDLTAGGDPDAYRYWDVPGYTSPALDPATPYYVYLKASKTAETASVVLSETPLKETTTDYLFLAGILNSEDSDSGSRSYVPLHGVTEITPGQMRTDRVVSADGSVVFDLAGNALHIGSTDGKSYLDYNTLGDGKMRIKGGLMTVGDADTTIEEALQEQEDKRQALDRDRPAVWAIEIYDTAAPLAPAVFDDKLAGYRTQATYAFRILRSGIDVTEWARSLSPPPWAWRRRNPTEVDDDGLSDTDWENAHAHDLTVTLTLRDIAYRCDLSIEADSDTLETLYKSKN